MTRWEPFDTNVFLVHLCYHQFTVLAFPQIGLQIRKLRTQGIELRICEPISYRKHLRICGKKSWNLPQIRRLTTSLECFGTIYKKKRFYGSMYRQSWVVVFIKYHTPLPSSTVLERLFSKGAAILTAKRANLTSRNFQQLFFWKKIRLFEMEKGYTSRHAQHV